MPSYYQPPALQMRESITDTFDRTSAVAFEQVREKFTQQTIRDIHGTVFFPSFYHFKQLDRDLSELALLPPGWNSYDSPVPTEGAIAMARSILEILQIAGLQPRRVLPSADGGVALVFMPPNDNRAIVESLNEDGVFILLYDREGNSRTIPWLSHTDEERDSLLESLRRHVGGEPIAAKG